MFKVSSLLILCISLATGVAGAVHETDQVEASPSGNRSARAAEIFSEQRWPKQYAGYWVGPEKNRSTYFFGFTRKANQKVEILRSRYGSKEFRLSSFCASYSKRHLKAIQREVTTELERREGGWGIGLNLEENRVQVTIPVKDPLFAYALRQRYGAAIVVFVRPSPSPAGGNLTAP